MTVIKGVGIDIIEIERFRSVLKKRNDHFFKKMFSDAERKYCFSYADPAPHFAGTFAGKEAASKALGGKYHISMLEVRRSKSGKPEIWKNGKRLPKLPISISHADAHAVAVCIAL